MPPFYSADDRAEGIKCIHVPQNTVTRIKKCLSLVKMRKKPSYFYRNYKNELCKNRTFKHYTEVIQRCPYMTDFRELLIQLKKKKNLSKDPRIAIRDSRSQKKKPSRRHLYINGITYTTSKNTVPFFLIHHFQIA